MPNMIRVLSIDGGGIRGIIPAKLLIRLEELLQFYSGNQEAHLSDYFDLIAGTSTGAILTSLYLCPEIPGSTKSKYSAKEVLDLYVNEGTHIFEKTIWSRVSSGFGLFGPKYLPHYLEHLLAQYLGEVRMEDLVKPCLIPAYDIVSGDAMFFNQMKGYRDEAWNFLVRDVVRGSTAAPTYFPVAKISDSMRGEMALIDGGMFANNPALCAFIEACKFPFNPSEEDILIFSLGTGAKEINYEYEKARNWGDLQWAMPALSIYGSAASQTVHHQLSQLYESNGLKDQYIRIEPELEVNHVSHQLDNASKDNIQALLRLGDQMIVQYDEKLKVLARKLIIEQIGRRESLYRMSFES